MTKINVIVLLYKITTVTVACLLVFRTLLVTSAGPYVSKNV